MSAATAESQRTRRRPLAAWAQALRLPNLFTVPGDAIAGSVLAGGGLASSGLALTAGSVLLIYAGGLLLNDWCDREEDARDRPDRPLPAGELCPQRVLLVAIGCFALGIVLALAASALAGGLAALLVLAAAAYDLGVRRMRLIGPLAMGGCRGLSVLVGAAAALPSLPDVGWTAPAIAATTLCAYIATLTVVAADETSGERPDARAALPLIVLVVGFAAANYSGPLAPNYLAGIVFLLVAGEQWRAVSAVRRGSLPVPAFVGTLLRSLILVQGTWLLLARPEPWLLLPIVLLRFAANRSSRRFYAS